MSNALPFGLHLFAEVTGTAYGKEENSMRKASLPGAHGQGGTREHAKKEEKKKEGNHRQGGQGNLQIRPCVSRSQPPRRILQGIRGSNAGERSPRSRSNAQRDRLQDCRLEDNVMKIQNSVPLLSLRIHLVGYLVSKGRGSRSKCPVDTADQGVKEP